MNLEELSAAWQKQSHGQLSIAPSGLAARLVQNERRFARTIFWRDVREVGVVLLLLPLMLYLGIAHSLPWTWYLSIPALVWTALVILIDRRRQIRNAPQPEDSVLDHLDKMILQARHQVYLLRNVFWNYQFPLLLSVNVFFLHCAIIVAERQGWMAGAGSAIVLLGFSAVVDWLVYVANQYAVRHVLQPRVDELTSLRTTLDNQFNDETTS